MKRHVILIGLPGSGKTTVGRLLAESLQAGFVDVDAVLERKQGKLITMIFAEGGESAFRQLERQEVLHALENPPAIVAPGGGWAAFQDNLAQVGGRALVVYLKTRPETATKRSDTQAGTRPMMAGEDPLQRVKDLLKEREPFYLKAHAQVETDRLSAAQVAAKIAELARSQAGW